MVCDEPAFNLEVSDSPNIVPSLSNKIILPETPSILPLFSIFNETLANSPETGRFGFDCTLNAIS